MSSASGVRAWEESVTIPTYPVPPADLNPMFLEKRVYQGSSGKVYPNPFTDRVSDEKKDQSYKAVFLENEYVRLMILPEIGGRIHIGLDKTNNYDFFYRQRVIKPALVGLLGPWISGGVEFNWPQHHRPSTFMPVDHLIERHEDGSCAVQLSEHEPMNRTKGMVSICLYPGKAIVEAKVQLYNRTPLAQTFLWWANAGVHVHERYEAFFPPDVTYVADHAKRAVTEFPIARGFYYGVDYRRGVDIRWYKNIPVPTSYMVTESRNDFLGGYDHERQAGIVHYADHHIAPGKKLWTWGNAEFGYAWDRELTDSDGPYIELMAGIYTDNQPDFSWIAPYETKIFSHYWYPIQKIGPAKNANRFAAVNLEVAGERARIAVCVTEIFSGASIRLKAGDRTLLERRCDLKPGSPFLSSAGVPEHVSAPDLLLRVDRQDGSEIIRYQPERPQEKPNPSPAAAPPWPEEIQANDELYVTGLHLEQYRHATRHPEPYWREALRRDPDDARSNNALGLSNLRRGLLEEAEKLFRKAIARLTRRNPNPYDGEPYYNLGLALEFQGRHDEAANAFSKAVWSHAWQAAGYYALAQIDCRRRDFHLAIGHLELSLAVNALNTKARNLKAACLRRLSRIEEAQVVAGETAGLDPLDFWSRNELALCHRAAGNSEKAVAAFQELQDLMRRQAQTYLDIAFDYAAAGLRVEANELLERLMSKQETPGYVHPIALYTLGWFAEQEGDPNHARQFYRQAGEMPSDYCFPSRLEEMLVLESAVRVDPSNAKAFYYLGNLLYDKGRYEEAIRNWERSCEIDPGFSIPWRNLGIAYFNVRRDGARAVAAYQKAREANPGDARLLYEEDQLQKRLGALPEERAAALEARLDLVRQRDDLTIELVTRYIETGREQDALTLLLNRRFHPWEGGEGLVSGAYVWAHVILGSKLLDGGRPAEALEHFEAARHYPQNLGEGRHLLTPENHLHYFAGLANEDLGRSEKAAQCFRSAAEGRKTLSAMSYYQALGLIRLGQQEAAKKKLEELLDFAEAQIKTKPVVDYFATSLPNFLLFEDDMEKRNRTGALFLIGLARLGLGQLEDAKRALEEVLALDPNHLGAIVEMHRIPGLDRKAGGLGAPPKRPGD